MAMCQTICKSKKSKFFIAEDANPQTIAVCQVRAEPMGIEVVVGDPFKVTLDSSYMGILLPYPATDGSIKDFSKVLADAKVIFLPFSMSARATPPARATTLHSWHV